MTAEVITFDALRQKTYVPSPTPSERLGPSKIVKNERSRLQRRDEWWRAQAEVRFWDALLALKDAVESARRHGLGVADGYAECGHDERMAIVDCHRDALRNQLMLPAPDLEAVKWKRRVLIRVPYGIDENQLRKAIAADIAWLNAHPTRGSEANKRRKR